MNKNFIFFILFYFSFICSEAQEKDTLDYLEMSLEQLMQIKITTASRVSQKATDAPATVYVVTENQIKFRGYSCLSDLLEDIPQIEIQKKSISQSSNIFTVNGIFGSEKFIVLMDGIRINSSTGTKHTIHESYSLINAKQVEVILGPASSLYGADAFTGVINIITKRGDENKNLHLSASYGSFNSFNSAFVYGLGNDEISFSLTGKIYHSDEPYFPDIYKEEYKWYNDNYKPKGEMLMFGDTVILPIKEWKTPTNSYFVHAKLNVKDFEIGYSRNYESHSNSFGSSPSIYVYSDETIYNTHIESFYAKYNFLSEDERLHINTEMSTQEFKVYPESQFLNQYASYLPAYKYENNKVIKLEEQIDYKISDDFLLLAGFSIEDINSLPKTSDLPFEYNENLSSAEQLIYYPSTNIIDKDSNDLTIYQDFHNIKYRNFGSYFQVQKKILNNITLSAGLRYDYNSRYNYSINPRLGLVYSKNKIIFKLLYGSAYLAPSPYKSYQHYGSFSLVRDDVTNEITGLASGFWHLPNQNLEAEKRQSYEFYTLYQINSGIAFSVNGYFSKIENLIDSEGFSNEVFHGINVDFVSKSVNKGDAETYGFTAKLDIKNKISEYISIDCFSAYSFSDGNINDNPLIFNTKNTLKTGIGINFKNKFSIFTKILYRSKSHYRKSNSEKETTNDAFTCINLYTKYKFYDNDKLSTSLFLKIDNLLNSKFYNAGYEGLAKTPQDPIKIMMGINLDF
ncbi:MAG: hypothetical protein B6I24_03380 [Bacteroidetes bacterium 4572_128]|nr:MAG: hypothetical protein B6I24_03380 [Bacteroidetes bacterium 4572_128]